MIQKIRRWAKYFDVTNENLLLALTEILDLIEDRYTDAKSQGPKAFREFQRANAEMLRWHNEARAYEQRLIDELEK